MTEKEMDGEMLGMAIKMRKMVTFTTLRCYRSVSSHPFLVGFLCFLVFLYRWFPFVFSLLVSASPVLICTAVLLGTLLSFGQPNLPESEKDEKASHDFVSRKTGVSEDAVVIGKNENYCVEKFNGKRGVVVEQLNSIANSRTVELHRRRSIDSSAPPMKEMSGDLEHEDMVVAEERTKIHDSGYIQKNNINDGRLGYGDAKTDDGDNEMGNDKSHAESFDSERVNVDSLYSPPGSPGKHVGDGEEQEERDVEDDEDIDSGEEQEERDTEDEEDIDSGSDRADSSSPDASMADIMPMFDELHPLLDEDAPLPVARSHDGSDAASECSLKSSDSSTDLDDNMEKDEQVKVTEEDDDEDEGHGDQDGPKKSAITWTEEDRRNLMDLGTSELERNQRLESLIARRRARKIMSMIPERNLIDLESADLPFSIAPISTARDNPFDLPHYSYDDLGLPPIPVSAPSILLARRNPIDLPHELNEEKPDLLGDSFRTAALPRESFFRRHESFNLGSSFFGSSRQERQDSRLRPYFVLERLDSEGMSYSSFQQQSSGLSDSKASSVPETDSVASAGDNEQNLLDENVSLTTEPLNSVPGMELRDSTEDLDNRDVSEEDVYRELDVVSMKENNSSGKIDISQEQELISNIEHVSEHVGHGSQTSEDTDSLELGEIEKSDAEVNKVETGCQHMQNNNGAKPFLFEEVKEESSSCSVKLSVNVTNLSGEAAKQAYRSTSSSSSLTELNERIFFEREGKGLFNLEERTNPIVEDAGNPIQPSNEGSHFNMTSDTSRKEPVYDSSPPAIRKNLSSSSISSDSHVESDIQPILIKKIVSFAGRELESRQDTERDPSNEMYGPELMLPPIDESQSRSMMSIESSDGDVMRFNISGAYQGSNNASGILVFESMADNSSHAVDGDLIYQHGSEYLSNQSYPLVYTDVHIAKKIVPPPIADSMTRPDQNLAPLQALSSIPIEEVLPPNVPYTGNQSTAEYSIGKEVALQPELGRAPSIISDTNIGDDVPIEREEKQTSAHNEPTSEERPVAEYGEELVFLDKFVDETSSSREHQGEQ